MLLMRETSKIISTRCNIVKVCNYWYSIGKRQLHSHLKIIYDTPKRALTYLRDALVDTPDLVD